MIVTLNLKDFPADTLADYNLEAQHPDDFVMDQQELREHEALAAIKRMRARLRNPPRSPDEFIETLERNGLVQTARRLRQRVELI